MTDLLEVALNDLAPSFAGERPDWADVLRRSAARRTLFSRRPDRVRKTGLILAAALVVLAVAVPAFAFRSEIIDFFTATAAPKSVVVYFDRLQVEQSIPFPRAAPGIRASQARRITTETVAGKRSALYVAPTKRGGFCALWTSNYTPRCYAERPTGPPGQDRWADISWQSADPSAGIDTLQGEVFARGATVTLSYADGKTTNISYVWVTAPIRAGFFIYAIPTDRQTQKLRAVAVTVTLHGKLLVRQPIEAMSTRVVNHRDRWGISIQSSPEAVWSKRRLLYSFNAADNSLVEEWVMPSRRSAFRRCIVASFYYGCEPTRLAGTPVQVRLMPGASVLVWGEVSSRVRRVELRYQDGTRSFVTPKDGIVLTKLARSRNNLGHRLIRAIGIDNVGRQLGSVEFDARQRNVYPCLKPKNYGYGVTACP